MDEFPSREAFLEWLEGRPSGEKICGQSWTDCNCPLATWIQDITGEIVAIDVRDRNDPNSYSWGSPSYMEPRHRLPDWARHFVDMVDEFNGDGATAALCRDLAVKSG